ncbi:TetR/AcrR family transcriptional regulator [Nocardioides sp. cx-173]|uniref:TetR/AcrR family transcriptional regulator n=1 Tax=Nocardioides sp. cx-173 TaxID=2898796 RepID=UPI001E4F3643|nr:TetR/AcrR family transcriptional regulator [Nocardioides sp. cx-173]MCD4526611.1 TetR/AcrR family transcriptional regulator [Nocardioides sp. cx-173]UGB40704.1 TetR/AcrR family transcriptional regulator [Nocardioides sp. cx-173]
MIEATLDIASERGYDGTTVALVTERTGLPASSIYWHFGSKDKLLAATLEHSYDQWRSAIGPWATSGEPDALPEKLEYRMQKASVGFAMNPQFWGLGLLLAMQQRVEEPAARRIFVEVRRQTTAGIRDDWRELVDPAVLERDPAIPDQLAEFYMILMDGMFVHVRSTAARDVPRMVSLIADGMAAMMLEEGWAS